MNGSGKCDHVICHPHQTSHHHSLSYDSRLTKGSWWPGIAIRKERGSIGQYSVRIHNTELLTWWCFSSWNLCHEHETLPIYLQSDKVSVCSKKLDFFSFFDLFHHICFIFHHYCCFTFIFTLYTDTICAARRVDRVRNRDLFPYDMNRYHSHPLVPTSQRANEPTSQRVILESRRSVL